MERPLIVPELSEALTMMFGSAVRTIRGEIESSDLGEHDSTLVFSRIPSRESVRRLIRSGRTQMRRFAVLPSHNMPRWVVPIGDARATLAATQIYFPHRWAPKTLKTLLTGIIKIGCSGWLRKILVASKNVSPLEDLARDIMGERQVRFALSLGRQAAVRKLTVQVMRPGGDILGYFKLPLTDAANERVRNEATILQRLWNFPNLRSHIPRLLFAGKWNGRYALFQSPLNGEAGPVNFHDLHKRFLAILRECHAVEKPGHALVEEVAANWRTTAPNLSDEWRDLGQEVLRRSSVTLQGRRLLYNVVHGDFAPWNTRVHRNELQLFDWECGTWEGPSAWDSFHFRVQTASAFNDRRETYLPFDLPATEQTSFMLYLVNSVCQLLQEQNHKEISFRQGYLRRFLNGNGLTNARSNCAAL